MNKYSDLQFRTSVSRLTPLNIITPKSGTFDVAEICPKHSSTRSLSKEAKISAYSQVENFRTEALTRRILFTPQEFNSNMTLDKLNIPDFKKILSSLNKISFGLEDIKEIKYSQIESVIVNEGSLVYFKIKSVNKKSPLKVEIRKKFGKVQWFISRSHERPNIKAHESTFADDYFEITEGKPFFSCEWIYFGILGLSSSEFSFTTKFANSAKQFSFEEKLLKLSLNNKVFMSDNELSKDNLILRVERFLRNRKEKVSKFTNGKNFIKLNKESSKSILFKNIDPWNERKDQALSKKKIKIQEKVQKAKDSINKKTVRLEKLQTEIGIERENKRFIKIRQRLWLRLMFFHKYSRWLRGVVETRREAKLKALKNKILIRKIQRNIRSFIHSFNSKQIALLLARNNLLFMQNFEFILDKLSLDLDPIPLGKSNSSTLISKCIRIFTQKSFKSGQRLPSSTNRMSIKKVSKQVQIPNSILDKDSQ